VDILLLVLVNLIMEFVGLVNLEEKELIIKL
jgi:hypothetical protein